VREALAQVGADGTVEELLRDALKLLARPGTRMSS
jgi:hypothetical protein